MENDIQSEISIEGEMKKSYLEYAMSVIIGRALPDVRDGLKPVHRRVLFAMRELKNDWNKPYKKSARVVGDVIGKYHPHGDTAVYDTIVRMAQSFSLRYMLVDGQGNFGSVDGDSPAAMRYTEVRMKRIAHEMLEDLDKDTVDWIPNYDESMSEPSVFPAKLPNLLVNGSSGIAVGMATNIPPHNLSEIIDAVTALIDNPQLTYEELMEYVPGPDFPTAAMIYGRAGILSAYKTGRGIIRLRARIVVEEDKKTKAETIVVNELPYQVNKARVIENISILVRTKVIEGVRYVRDESDREGMRIAVGLKRDQVAGVVINQLYKHTQLQNSFGIILLAVVNNRPELLTLKEILEHFIFHRAEAKSNLIDRFNLSIIQAQAILDMRLQRLTGLERDKIVEEYESVKKDIEWFKKILGSEQIVLGIIKDDLAEIKTEFGDERRTEIVEAVGEISIEDMIKEEDMVVTISKSGYIKRNPVAMYESQRRGGKGKTAMGVKEDDFLAHIFVASTHHTFLFITNFGKVYQLKVYQLPMAGRVSKGRAIVNLLDLSTDEKIATVLAVPSFDEGKHIIMTTKLGRIKKTELIAYARSRSKGLIGVKLAEGDELIAAGISDDSMDVFLSCAAGKSIRFKIADIRSLARGSMGVRGMRLGSGDRLIGMEVLSSNATLLALTENGFGKRTSIDEYRVQKRGGKGVITIKTSERNGLVVVTLLVEDDDDLMIMTDGGKLIRMSVATVSVISRNTQGVKLIK
ncbi:MAG: DNA gyrase subunit A [Desulfobacteraceae bacterium 4572_19]|nr:MAG: DNA gyrase subunit A [Desulfobacteraceae bacterium 4572_19]